jgi:hypothetical protein
LRCEWQRQEKKCGEEKFLHYIDLILVQRTEAKAKTKTKALNAKYAMFKRKVRKI